MFDKVPHMIMEKKIMPKSAAQDKDARYGIGHLHRLSLCQHANAASCSLL